MEMTRCTAAILLMLSLGALFVGRLSAAVADDGVDTIRLPSHGLADELVKEEEAMPSKCCKLARCTKMFPATCQCVDQVKQCADTCKLCQKDNAASLYVCRDWYAGMPDNMCTNSVDFLRGNILPPTTNHGGGNDGQPGADPGLAGPEATAEVAATTEMVSKMSVNGDGEEETRPVKCCDLARCARSLPPICQCMDKVKKCADTCKSCEKVKRSSRHVCLDQYSGKQGPACTPGAPPPPPTLTPRGN